MLRWATSRWLRVVTSKRMETVARKALVEALCISLSPLRWPIQMFESWKLMLILKVMLKMPTVARLMCMNVLCSFFHLWFSQQTDLMMLFMLAFGWKSHSCSTVYFCFIYPIEFPGQARDQVCENIPMRKNREILDYLKWDLVSKIHFPIFDAVVSFFWKNEVIQVKSNCTTIKLNFAWLAWQREILLQLLLIETYWWPTS